MSFKPSQATKWHQTQITTPQSSLPPLLPTTSTCPPKSFISSWHRQTSLFQARGILSCDASPTMTAQPRKTHQNLTPLAASPNISPQNLFTHWRPTLHLCFVMSCHARMLFNHCHLNLPHLNLPVLKIVLHNTARKF